MARLKIIFLKNTKNDEKTQRKAKIKNMRIFCQEFGAIMLI